MLHEKLKHKEACSRRYTFDSLKLCQMSNNRSKLAQQCKKIYFLDQYMYLYSCENVLKFSRSTRTLLTDSCIQNISRSWQSQSKEPNIETTFKFVEQKENKLEASRISSSK